jgi:hypothetical protein
MIDLITTFDGEKDLSKYSLQMWEISFKFLMDDVVK